VFVSFLLKMKIFLTHVRDLCLNVILYKNINFIFMSAANVNVCH
jgi:hypothetical protein